MHYKIFVKGLFRHITAKLEEKYYNKILALNSNNHCIPLSIGTYGYKMIKLKFSFVQEDKRNIGLVEFELHKSVKSIDAIEIVIQMAGKLLDELK